MLFFTERSYQGGGGGGGGLVDVLIPARDVPSRAVRPRRPLGQPVLSGSVLVVGGGAGGPSGVVV